MERVLKALANRRRLAIVKLLREKKEMSVGEMAEEIDLSFKATSKHLALLYSAGIVEKEQRSLMMFYRLAPELSPVVKNVLSHL